ncbi:glycosyltransferase family 2 protein [Bacillus sp. AFS041924]|uniref:glycosyltransferase family 2 protein n=1 Tax=Bacillus sp. AFS041924 TaxID=2033503 RepID=UPI000BFD6DB2|nr:glycosyltransferase family 2 protein [Bacillus sp. AFS041924]PGS52660.1 glycosyl transferase family 2 [Bacillus sp. AFS041924]
MKISIIVAAYNVENYIEKCLKSVTEQTYKQLEIIVVNDGSTDYTLEVIQNISKTDKRIVIVNKSNGGLSSARNAGLDRATGDYIGFVDGDDNIAADMYEGLLEEMQKHKCEIAMCGVLKVYNDYTEHDSLIDHSVVLNKVEALDALIEEKYIKHYAVNKLYKSTLFQGVRYPEGRLYEDIFTTYKLFAQANRIVYSNKIGYYYIQREGSILRSKYNVRKLDCILAFSEFKAYIDTDFPELSQKILWRINLSKMNSLLDMLKSESLYENCEFIELGSSLTKEIRKNSFFFMKGSGVPTTFRILAPFSYGGYPFMRMLFKTTIVKNFVQQRSLKLL